MFWLVDHGSTSGLYRVLSFNSDTVSDPSVSSLLDGRLLFSLPGEIDVTGKDFDDPWCVFSVGCEVKDVTLFILVPSVGSRGSRTPKTKTQNVLLVRTVLGTLRNIYRTSRF